MCRRGSSSHSSHHHILKLAVNVIDSLMGAHQLARSHCRLRLIESKRS